MGSCTELVGMWGFVVCLIWFGEIIRLREAKYIISSGGGTRSYRPDSAEFSIVGKSWIKLWRFTAVIIYINLVYSYGFSGSDGVWWTGGGFWLYCVGVCGFSYVVYTLAMHTYGTGINFDIWCAISLVNFSLVLYLCIANIFVFIFILECQSMLLLYLLSAGCG